MLGGVVAFACVIAGVAHAAEDAAAALKRADGLKSADNAAFVAVLEDVAARERALDPAGRAYLHYLQAWQKSYRGDYDAGLAGFDEVYKHAEEPSLKFRAVASTVNVLAIARRYNEAFSHLDTMLGLLPKVTDEEVRQQGLLTAAQIHNQVGQFDVALRYARQLIAAAPTGRVLCPAYQLEVEALFRSGQLAPGADETRRAIEVCTAARELIFLSLVRVFEARLLIGAGRAREAIALLDGSRDDVEQTHYPRAISDYDAVLAQAFLAAGDDASAARFAQEAVGVAVPREYTEPIVGAYRTLFEVARKRGELGAALDWHERYAAADKGYLDDVGARQLAYQMARSQAAAAKLQIEALSKANQVLQLQSALSAKSAENARLYVMLLITLVAFAGYFAYRTKRSQLHYKTLAQRDGLTGIANRQHFIAESELAVAYCRKSGREVCVVLLDLDHFKQVNDKYGHSTGDLVLRRAVAACESRLRSIDLFGRLGGEEFGVLMPDCALDEAKRRAEDLRAAIAALNTPGGEIGFAVSASFGVASTATSGYALHQLIADADEALYRAKARGRDRVELFERAA